MLEIAVLTTTLPITWTDKQVEQFKFQIIDKKLAACIQHYSINSTYSWKQTVINEDEWKTVAKTTIEKLAILLDWVCAEHPYETPQIIHHNEATTDEYFAWVSQQVE